MNRKQLLALGMGGGVMIALGLLSPWLNHSYAVTLPNTGPWTNWGIWDIQINGNPFTVLLLMAVAGTAPASRSRTVGA